MTRLGIDFDVRDSGICLQIELRVQAERRGKGPFKVWCPSNQKF